MVRRKLKAADRSERQQLLAELAELEKVQKRTPVYDPDRRHPCKLGYVRYADDFVILVNGSQEEAETVKAQVADKLGSMGLKLSEEKTKLTHWSQPVRFLGFEVQGRMRDKGVQIKAIFSIPADKCERIRQEIQQVCGCHQIPEADAMARVSLMFRGWCNYYRFASGRRRRLVGCRTSPGGSSPASWPIGTRPAWRMSSSGANGRNDCGPSRSRVGGCKPLPWTWAAKSWF